MIELKTDGNESTATHLPNIYRGLLVSKRLKDFSFLTYLWWTICLLVIFTQCVSRKWASMNKSRYYATYLQFSFLLCTQLRRPLRRCEYFLRNPWNNYAHTFRWTTWLLQSDNLLIPYCFCCKSLLLSHKKIVSFYKEPLVILWGNKLLSVKARTCHL